MLQIQSFTFNPFQENTYLVSDSEHRCWIVDPGMYDAKETNLFISYIEDNGLKPQSIINTHAHIDHIFGVQTLIDRYSIPFGLNERDLPVLNGAAGSAVLFGLSFGQTPKPSFYLADRQVLELGSEQLELRPAPGHSPGSVVFYYAAGKWLIGGDVLFSGSIGRTDLPGGNYETLIRSIHSELFSLPDDTVVHSGHGPATTIGNERKYNPFLNQE
jgi:hydroxyacylglutathione hydrolase